MNSKSAQKETTTPEKAQESKEERISQWIYPASEMGGGIYKAYFSSYISMLMTTIYVFPIAISGVLETLQSLIGWFVGPIMGGVLDKFSFKKSKFWPWFLISGAGTGIFYILIFAIPVFSADPSKMILPAVLCIVIASVLVSTTSILGVSVYIRAAKTPDIRAKISMREKIARDGMKLIVGFLFPFMLVYFTDTLHNEVQAWALIAAILSVSAILIFVVTAIMTKHSSIEREAMQEKSEAKARKKTSAKAVAKSIFTNRALLITVFAMATTKVFFFFYFSGGSYFWRYYVGDFSYMSVFVVALNLSAILGVLFMPLWNKLIKDTKRCFVSALFLEAIVYVISLKVVTPDSPIANIVIFSAASFFAGLAEGFILPMFAAATDYGIWKTGANMRSLSMSTYGLSVRIGSVLSIAIRTALLGFAGFDSKAIASGAAVPAEVKTTLFNMTTVYPLILTVIVFVAVLFLYPITDKKLEQYRRDIAERQTAQ